MDKKTMYKLSYGLFVLTAKVGDKDNGCITNTVIQAASEPNQISVCINKANLTHDMVKETGVFTASVISEAASFELFKRFGFQSGRDVEKFDGFSGMARGENGVYFITDGTNAYISCQVTKMIDLGSHTMFIATVSDMEVLADIPSATYAYYMDHIKPKPEPVAKVAENKATEGKAMEGKTVWRCRVCGHEYVGEELPDDFTCPVCKHPAWDFEKVENEVVPEKAKAINERKSDMKFYVCERCGNFVGMIKESGVPMFCCGEPMTEVIPGTVDAAVEKHVPVVTVEGNKAMVKVGEVEHPMEDVHYIEWIALETVMGVQRKVLKPGEVPCAEFALTDDDSVVAAYAYCNLHGLWKAE